MVDERKILEAKILIVDDNQINVLLLERILQAAGYTNVKSLLDPRDVMELYEEWRPDCVLLDIKMPHMDGFMVMEELKKIELDSYIPVLVLTANQDHETRITALNTGAKDFLNKPFDRIEALNRIRNLIEVRLLHNEVRDQNASLEEKVAERTKEIHNTRLEIIRRLGRASEYKDNETGLHIIRMSKVSQVVGLTYGLNEKHADLLLHASPMHDVGKIGIPDSILLKPGKLDADEWRIMKTHTNIGFEILSDSDSDLLLMAQNIAIGHHEKWDGSGYPKGLKGEEIPIEARIAAVADVFDALTSERPYKKAWPVEDAIALLKDQKGKHFQAELIDIFLEKLDSVIEITEELRDEPLLHNED